MWENHYKPSPAPAPTKSSNRRLKPSTGILAGLSGASEARAGTMSTDPLSMWLAGGLTLDSNGQPVNQLKWWIQQGRAGNTHGGLLQMALDVLSCPATTVDVERSFNFWKRLYLFQETSSQLFIPRVRDGRGILLKEW
ncbi:hypothetical protein PSTG_02424 [Puccinia striiformis f. sp. tritici PST-78]|uniref:HAT C-terminal dimerisation domain-containing protein n=1 Tax=Puccinia striiformis f. sp. tritici PST-78 TaxID=1165861 RepID=A0A0L0VYZ9_9BASI|nr:hypothetical protein PSTG_02424 [Puccinia striiformis f. sp. tritici PST-78]